MKFKITQLLLFHKDLCTLSRGPDIEPLSCQNLIGVGLCEGKVGCFDVVVVFIILFFSKSELKTQIIFLPNKQNLEKIFPSTTYLSRIFPSSTLKINLCTSRRTQLQHSFEIRVSFAILR